MGSQAERSLWDKVAANLQDWYSEAREWTGEKARIGVKKMDMVGIQHNIKRTMTHLGGRVYDVLQRREDVAADEEVQRIVETLRRLEQELAAREREIDELRARRGEDAAEPAAASIPAGDRPRPAAEEPPEMPRST